MTTESRPRILVVDDEEAILETMTFTFEDDYEVFTCTDARRALDLLDQHAPFAAVLTDQRMPNMSGVEFVTEVWKRHPATVRMILTGFSDMEAIIQAINDGHVYAYVPPTHSDTLSLTGESIPMKCKDKSYLALRGWFPLTTPVNLLGWLRCVGFGFMSAF